MARKSESAGVPLHVLLEGLAQAQAGVDLRITGLCMDSRTVHSGTAFIASPGSRTTGARYAREALDAGAAAVLIDPVDRAHAPRDARVFEVAGLRGKASTIAARFFGEPASSMELVGVTGTNGKTSVSHYAAAALDGWNNGAAGLIGTLGHGRPGRLVEGGLTTPDAVALQGILAQLRAEGIRRVVMEVSSHALDQERVAGVPFAIAVLTNLTHDHLDYHGDLGTYAAAKRRLFEQPGLRHAVINLDDPFGRELAQALAGRVPVTGYMLNAGPTDCTVERLVAAELPAVTTEGLHLGVRSPWGTGVLRSALCGRFNGSNLAAALAVLCLLEVPFDEALRRLETVAAVPGRLEAFRRTGRPTIVVDYAHTPDALRQVLATLREQCSGRLVCVFGCGGDRDPAKRPLMGAAAAEYADAVMVTSDNPRGEAPDAIIAQILAGIPAAAAPQVEPDRAAAIRRAVSSAGPGDVVLVAGKGHETWQEIAGRRYPFSDRQLVRTLLEGGA